MIGTVGRRPQLCGAYQCTPKAGDACFTEVKLHGLCFRLRGKGGAVCVIVCLRLRCACAGVPAIVCGDVYAYV